MNPTGSRSRYANYIVILFVVVVSALLAKGFLKPGQADPLSRLGGDIKQSLDGFWGHGQSLVEVTGTPAAANLQVDAALPPATRPLQQAWTLPLVRFIAARHRDIQVAELEVKGGAPQDQARSLEAPQGRRAYPGSPFSDPAHFEEARSEVLRRNAQLALDQTLGERSALVLVDVVSGDMSTVAPPTEVEAPPPSTRRAPHGIAPRENRFEAAPSRSRRPGGESKVMPTRAQLDVAQIHARVVFRDGQRVEEAMQLARGHLGIQEGRGDTFREFVLQPL